MRYIEVIYDCNLCGCQEEYYFIVPDNYCDRDIELSLHDFLDTYFYDIESFIREEDYESEEEYEFALEDLMASAYFEWKEVDPLSEEYDGIVFFGL